MVCTMQYILYQSMFMIYILVECIIIGIWRSWKGVYEVIVHPMKQPSVQKSHKMCQKIVFKVLSQEFISRSKYKKWTFFLSKMKCTCFTLH